MPLIRFDQKKFSRNKGESRELVSMGWLGRSVMALVTRVPSSVKSGLHEYPYHPNTATLGLFIRSVCLFRLVSLSCAQNTLTIEKKQFPEKLRSRKNIQKKRIIKIELKEYLLNFRISKYT